MSKVKTDENYGIHTIELYANNLKYTEVQKAIDNLMETGEIQKIKMILTILTGTSKVRILLKRGYVYGFTSRTTNPMGSVLPSIPVHF